MGVEKRAASPAQDEDEELFYPVAGPAPKKRARKSKGGDEDQDEHEHEDTEKRLAIFKKKCPKSIEERYERVMTQRMLCVERTRQGEYEEVFKVVGSTGNLYTVKIDHKPSCDCPDGKKNGQCKHILFALMKILRVPKTSNLWYQKALLTNELGSIFANAPRDRTDPREQALRDTYAIHTGKKAPPVAGAAPVGTQKRLPGKDDSCPVCYEDFEEGQEKGLVFCLFADGCGNGCHAGCFQEWAKKQQPVTCVFCRAKWTGPTPAVAAAGPSYSAEGYMDMGASAGLSQHRDTSTYYRGPQKGKKWDGGYGRYGRGDYGFY